MSQRTDILRYIFIAIVLALLGGGYVYTKFFEPNEIKEDFSFTKGKIKQLETNKMRNETNHTIYTYTVNGKKYERNSLDMKPCEGYEQNQREILNFLYPVVYNNKSPEKSRILISPNQFKEYGIPYQEDLRSFFEKNWSCK